MVEKVSEQTRLVEDVEDRDAALASDLLAGGDPTSVSSALPAQSSAIRVHDCSINSCNVHSMSSDNGSISGALISFAKCVAAVIASGLAASALSSIVQIAYSWGYLLVGSLFEQALESNQGGIAVQSLAFAISPFAFGWCFAYLKGLNRGGRMWTILFSVLAIFGLFGFSGMSQHDLDNLLHLKNVSMNDLILYLSLMTTAAGFCFGGYKVGLKSYASLRTRVRVRALAMAGLIGISVPLLADRLWALCVGGMAEERSYYLSSFLLVHDFLLYTLALIAAGALASTFARARNKGSAVVLGLFAGSPIIFAALLNLSGNLLSLSLDHWGLGANLGWRALASAGFINVATFAALCLGGLIGYRFSPQNPRRLKSGGLVIKDERINQPPLIQS